MKQSITVRTYDNLSKDNKLWYKPVYADYKVKKHRKYEECDLGHTHFIGWGEYKTPLGDPIGYYKIGVIAHAMLATILDRILSSNVLTERIMDRKKMEVA